MENEQVTTTIEVNTGKILELAEKIKAMSSVLHAAILLLKDCGVKVVYHCDTTELDKKVKELLEIKVYHAG